jgi:hypothetical protein
MATRLGAGNPVAPGKGKAGFSLDGCAAKFSAAPTAPQRSGPETRTHSPWLPEFSFAASHEGLAAAQSTHFARHGGGTPPRRIRLFALADCFTDPTCRKHLIRSAMSRTCAGNFRADNLFELTARADGNGKCFSIVVGNPIDGPTVCLRCIQATRLKHPSPDWLETFRRQTRRRADCSTSGKNL